MLDEAVAALKPSPRIIAGKSVINLIPQGSPHKGTAILELMKTLKLTHAVYVGDDVTDEDVFNLRHSKIFGIRIGQKNSSHAQYYVEKQSDIEWILKVLLKQLERKEN